MVTGSMSPVKEHNIDFAARIFYLFLFLKDNYLQIFFYAALEFFISDHLKKGQKIKQKHKNEK